MNKDQMYHNIALACLKTLREGGNAEAEDKVKRHYRKLERRKKQSTKAAKTVKEPSSKGDTTESLTEKLLAESKAQKK